MEQLVGAHGLDLFKGSISKRERRGRMRSLVTKDDRGDFNPEAIPKSVYKEAGKITGPGLDQYGGYAILIEEEPEGGIA